MRSFEPLRFGRAFPRRPLGEPTLYADAPLARVLTAIDRCAPDLEPALAGYAQARRAAGVRPETVIVEFKRALRRALGLDGVRRSAAPGDGEAAVARRLTQRLIELYFGK